MTNGENISERSFLECGSPAAALNRQSPVEGQNPQSAIEKAGEDARAPRFRLGVVAYLNMQPLVWGLESAYSRDELEVCVGPPSRLARWLEDGRIDAGMVPVAALFAHPEWRVAGRGMIGARGAVRSVLAAGGGPPELWRVLRPDAHSVTSNALARVLLKNIYGVAPAPGEPVGVEEIMPEPPTGEGCVLIGSHALAWGGELARRPGVCVIDLGEAWTRWTGLPFVFAVWAARPGVELGEWPARLERHRQANAARLEAIAGQWPGLAADRLTPAAALNYFTMNVAYELDESAREGLERFYREGRTLGLFPDGWAWVE